LKNVESDNNKILYEILHDILQRNGTYCLNKRRIILQVYMDMMFVVVIIRFLALRSLIGTVLTL